MDFAKKEITLNKLEETSEVSHQGAGVVVPDVGLDAAANPLIESIISDPKVDFTTKGQKIHKWGTYLGVDWIFNAITGVSFAYWGKHTEEGQRIWSGPLTAFFTKNLEPLIKDKAQLLKSAENGNTFMSIIAGGMFTIPPLMILENNKVKTSIVQSLDKKMYGHELCEQDERIKAAHDSIGEEPKKDFATGMKARFVSLAPLLAIVLIPATRKITNNAYFQHIERASDWCARQLGFSEKSFGNLATEEAKKRWDFIHQSVAMDLGLGMPYAMLHQFFYDKFAKQKQMDEEAIVQSEPSLVLQNIPTNHTIDKRPASSFVEKLAAAENGSSLAIG